VTDQNTFDIIIAGAGASGLSLLWRILDSSKLEDQSILLIDRSFDPVNDKTWCFWEDLELPDDDLVYHSWDRLKVQIDHKIYSEKLINHCYKCLRSKDFSDYILSIARKQKRVRFVETSIYDFSADRDYGIVHASNGDFKSKKIFQKKFLVDAT